MKGGSWNEEDLKKMKVRNWRERSVKIEDCGMKS
jgi:hypothetical protein